ncbi:uncharacterized protein N7484_003717 [Penicillium longicatenatum]|uniref:uncharacterized protein n=1 Tax=Penicillium longicatenatum TaxID=1561947 RepID=UPI002548CC08|nr:uncharacterized protein N7484_003717 [Penicillium longicatenatum]KAJ5649994.1 hypothetical protein N7484_003717 [Penicillium longicatenatum]
MGQFVDDITARYFRGIHSFIPIISRPRFHEQLVKCGAPPLAGFSILLLSMGLITYHPELVQQVSEPLDMTTLYVTTKTLFAQVQASSPPSLHLIQASTIIAAYEYAIGKFHDAFTTIGICARMGYTSRLHLANPNAGMDRNTYLQAEEESNTWWGIVACERIFYCEIAESQQPFAMRVPPREARLPTEPTLASFAVSKSRSPLNEPIATETTGGFACMAQATWLLDEVFKAMEVTDLDARLTQLDGLDHTLRTVLTVVMNRDQGAWGSFCAANAMIISRALFILHGEILHQVAHMGACKRKSPEQWLNSSRAALDSITKMVQDIAIIHSEVSALSNLDTLPPSCAFITRAALRHIDGTGLNGDQWDGARTREKLQMSWEKFNHRWNAVPKYNG